jgi:hypothetical protein
MNDFAPEWLALREQADAAARAATLLDPLRTYLDGRPIVVRDLGSGTGSMGRWLAPQLGGEQTWTLTDRDPVLLAVAATSVPNASTELRDITALSAADLAGTTLVTGSALLDILTAAEIENLAEACVGAGCPALFALTVVGRVELDPPHLLDAALTSAFNSHQRRTIDGRQLLGPSAVQVAAEAFHRRGAWLQLAPSPWRLGRDQGALIAAWLGGWVSAACEQQPDLIGAATAYLDRRLAECAAGSLTATIHHEDLLALPHGHV